MLQGELSFRGEDSDEDDIESGIDFDDIGNLENEKTETQKRKQIELMRREDEEYEGEWGYGIIKMLRGKTVGRRLRRKLFKFGVVEVLCGFAMLVMSILEDQNFHNTKYFDEAKYGATVMALSWLVSLPSVLLGLLTLVKVWHWASIVTNRKLLTGIMRIYTFLGLVMFMLTLWCVCAVFLTFQSVKDWSEDVIIQSMQAYYICTLIFIFPLLLAYCFYSLDVSYLASEVEKGGTIAELVPPDDVKDLSDVTLLQSCVFVVGMPCILCIQMFDIVKAVRRSYARHYRDEPFCPAFEIPAFCKQCFISSKVPSDDDSTSNEEKEEELPVGRRKKRSTIWQRIWRTCMRCFRGSRTKKAGMVQPVEIVSLPLRALEKDREQEEREKRELLLREQAEEQQRLARKELEEQEALKRKLQQEQEEFAKQQEAARLMEEQARKELQEAEEAANRWESVLSVTRFKGLWTSFATAGSFQCNLKTMPVLNQVAEHLKKQGFHVVFAVSPNADNMEIGICNIRPMGVEDWFMARFLIAKNTFSAVMKSNQPEIVPALVKKFALAKVLKIDTPGAK